MTLNPLNDELNPICHLLALLGAHPILHISRIRVLMLQTTSVLFKKKHGFYNKKSSVDCITLWYLTLPNLSCTVNEASKKESLKTNNIRNFCITLDVTPLHSMSHPCTRCHTLALDITPLNSISHPCTRYHTLALDITPLHSMSHPCQALFHYV